MNSVLVFNQVTVALIVLNHVGMEIRSARKMLLVIDRVKVHRWIYFVMKRCRTSIDICNSTMMIIWW